MSRKHNYPQNRKPAKPKKCPVCGQTFKARGIINHLRQSHGIDYVEKVGTTGEAHTAFIKEPPANVKSPDEALVELLNQLEIAHQKRQSYEYSVIVEEIAKVRSAMGWSLNDIAKESNSHLSMFRILDTGQSPRPRKKRLVVMFEDNSYREINFTDYTEVSHWISELQEIKDEFKARIQRYKDIPILLKIEKELGEF